MTASRSSTSSNGRGSLHRPLGCASAQPRGPTQTHPPARPVLRAVPGCSPPAVHPVRGLAGAAGDLLLPDQLARPGRHPGVHRSGQLRPTVQRRHLPTGPGQQPHPADRAAHGRDHPRLRPGSTGHRRRQQSRTDPRGRRRQPVPDGQLLPLRGPGRRGRHPLRLHLLAQWRVAQRDAGPGGPEPRHRLAGAPRPRPVGDHGRRGVVPGRLLHGAVRGRDQGRPLGDRRGRAPGRLWTVPARGGRDPADDPRERLHRRRVHGHRRPRHVRLHTGDDPQRRHREEHRGDLPISLRDRVPEVPVRAGLGHGCGAGAGDHADGRDRAVRIPTKGLVMTQGLDARSGPGNSPAAQGTSTRGTPTRRRGQTTTGDRVFGVIAHTVLTIWALLVVLPLIWTFYSSFKNSREILTSPFGLPETLGLDNFITAWQEAGIGRFFGNTVIVVGGALFLVMLLGSMCAYVLARYEFPGRRLIYYGMIAGLTFPLFLAVVPLFFVLQSMGLRNTYIGLILAYAGFALPFTVFFLYAFFRQLPEEIAESASIDGAGDFRTFFQVMAPMAAPGLASVTIFNFLGLWNQFLLPVVLNTDDSKFVLAQGLMNLQAQQGYQADWGAMFASVTITIAPVLIVYVIFQRQLQGGMGPSTDK